MTAPATVAATATPIRHATRWRVACAGLAITLVAALPTLAGAKENVLTYEYLGSYSRGFQMAIDASSARPCRVLRGERVSIEYDAHGRIVPIGDGGPVLRTRYDARGYLVEERYASPPSQGR